MEVAVPVTAVPEEAVVDHLTSSPVATNSLMGTWITSFPVLSMFEASVSVSSTSVSAPTVATSLLYEFRVSMAAEMSAKVLLVIEISPASLMKPPRCVEIDIVPLDI